MEAFDPKLSAFIDKNPKFKEFLSKQGIQFDRYMELLTEYSLRGRRCLRLRTKLEDSEIQKEFRYLPLGIDESEENIELLQLKVVVPEIHPLFPDLCLVSKDLKVNKLHSYVNGNVVGIEASSALIVKCLGIEKSSRVLDMCCSPGAKLRFWKNIFRKQIESKLMHMADILKDFGSPDYHSQIVGCDISYHRSQICKSMLAKHGHPLVKVIRGDSTRIKQILEADSTPVFKPNRILVDVECTHEGSLKHILKFVSGAEEELEDVSKIEDQEGPKITKLLITEKGTSQVTSSTNQVPTQVMPPISNKERKRRLAQQQKLEEERKDTSKYFSAQEKSMDWGVEGFVDRVLDEKKLGVLADLQTNLLLAAMDVCSESGEIIYSTCSLMKSQNEDILQKALGIQEKRGLGGEYTLEDSFGHLDPQVKSSLLSENKYGISAGSLEGTYYIHPNKYSTGGMFVSRIRRAATGSAQGQASD